VIFGSSEEYMAIGEVPSVAELTRRAGEVRLVLTDNDGVLTDAGVYYSEHGELLKRFSVRDGMGVELLREQEIETAIMTREDSGCVARRAEKLRMPYLYLGVQDKRAHLDRVTAETGLTLGQLAYIGDDVNDLEIIRTIATHGLTAAPADAMPQVKETVHYVCQQPGGHGAFRDFAEWLLALIRQQHREGESAAGSRPRGTNG
jgi:3-deoxy-D-manno-octulosonate 8-phosphate phosphatase (KDO 8-P phosphatase)